MARYYRSHHRGSLPPKTMFIISAVCFFVALSIFVFTSIKYYDFIPIEANAEYFDCYQDLVKKKKKHSQKYVVETICKVKITYQYNGEERTETLRPTNDQSKKIITRYIDPKHPHVSQQKPLGYGFSLIFIVMGIVFGTGGLLGLIFRKE